MHRFAFLLLLSAGSVGCASLFNLDDYGFTSDDDAGTTPPRADGGGPQPTEDGATPTVDAGPACRVNAECASTAEDPGICVKATGTCAKVKSPDCTHVVGDVTKDDAIILGALLGGEAALERAATLAAEEITKGGRPVAIVACETSTRTMDASRHLVDRLHVPAIVGPLHADDVVIATQQISAKGGSLLMTPTALATSIAQLADEGLTWRAVPADGQRAKLVIQQLTELENVIHVVHATNVVKLGIVHRGDAFGTSARDAISGKLIINGKFISDPANAGNVSDDAYPKANDGAAMQAITNKYASTFKPDVVYLTSEEQIAGVMVPLEAALTAARAVNRPYYVLTDTLKTKTLLDAIAAGSMPSDIKRRIRGVGVRPDTTSSPVYAAFEAAYTTRWGAAPASTEPAFVYDATYAVAFAVTAGGATGPSTAKGLRALGVGDGYSVGAKDVGAVLGRLTAKQSVSLRGTFSLMQWDQSGDIAAGTLEVWCIGGASAPVFGSSGQTMDVLTQVVGGSFVQCQ